LRHILQLAANSGLSQDPDEGYLAGRDLDKGMGRAEREDIPAPLDLHREILEALGGR